MLLTQKFLIFFKAIFVKMSLALSTLIIALYVCGTNGWKKEENVVEPNGNTRAFMDLISWLVIPNEEGEKGHPADGKKRAEEEPKAEMG